ncbi:MAG: helix-turn-helix transcriptional regulator [Pseudomonas sp.]
MTANARHVICPPPTARGINREGAANYIGVSASLFDEMVQDGRMPKPKRINSRTVWDVRALDRAFDLLPGGGADDGGEWDVAV